MASPQQTLRITWTNKDKALIPTEQGRYGYTWVEPSDPRYCETHYLEYVDTITGTQSEKEEGRTYSERAELEPQTDNLLVLGESGDVLEALTRVPELREKYVGKVKCVYIDPPFNTAQTFANYEDNLEHSVWLTMMRDRLEHLWKLLSDDGSIWVHLDDVENHRMRMLLDEVFGSANFVAEMQWEKTYSPRNDSKGIPAVTDPILVYRKTNKFVLNRLARTTEMNARYSNPDNDENGPWTNDNPCAPGAATHLGMIYGIQHPLTGEMVYPAKGACWRYSQSKMLNIFSGWGPYELGNITDEEIEQQQLVAGNSVKARTDVRPLVMRDWEKNRVIAQRRYDEGNWPMFWLTNRGRGGFRRKSYLADMPGRTPVNFLPHTEVGHTDGAKKEIQALFPNTNAFATPKPERLLERIIHIATNPGDIVLDVFAGSGTTAAVAQKMGRRWVTCELVEDTFDRFTRPRLEKVVNGEDMGGISTTKGERVDATENGLPEGLTADEAQKLVSLLNKAVKGEPALKKSADLKAVKDLVKTTKTPDTVNWRGGGGFTVAKLSPTCFDYLPDLGITVLTEHATGEVLNKSVAANLGFPLTDEPMFVGKRNREYLAVVEGVLTTDKVDDLMAQLPDKHSIVFAATEVPEGVAQHVRNYKNGSNVVHIPSSLFSTAQQEG